MKNLVFGILFLLGLLTAHTAFASHTITKVDPNRAFRDQTITAKVTGTGFDSSAMVAFSGEGITVNPTTFVSSTQLHINFTISSSASTTQRTLKITQTTGGSHDATTTFTVAPVPGETPKQRIPRNIVSANQFIDLLKTITDWLFVVLITGAVVFIVLAGWQFISAGGDTQAVSQARSKLLYAVIGIIVALLSRGLSFALQNIIGG